jgi:hypothetical protein
MEENVFRARRRRMRRQNQIAKAVETVFEPVFETVFEPVFETVFEPVFETVVEDFTTRGEPRD